MPSERCRCLNSDGWCRMTDPGVPMTSPTTFIEIEVDGKTVFTMRDIQVPMVGDSITISGPDKSSAPMTAGKSYAVDVKHRVWVKDTDQSTRREELRCILICEKAK